MTIAYNPDMKKTTRAVIRVRREVHRAAKTAAKKEGRHLEYFAERALLDAVQKSKS
jgi:predicted HicB family RNase H-like nuclease